MPVPKVHVMTYLSLGFKNQWGCIPDVKRLRHHHDFDRIVLAINKALNPRIVIFDGTYFLNRSGPMDGDPVRKNLLIASNGNGAGTLACTELMGISPDKATHLKLAQKIGMMPKNIKNIVTNTDLEKYKNENFYLSRTFINWITLIAFHNKFLTKLLYDSRFAGPIHELLYFIRGRPKDVEPKW